MSKCRNPRNERRKDKGEGEKIKSLLLSFMYSFICFYLCSSVVEAIIPARMSPKFIGTNQAAFSMP